MIQTSYQPYKLTVPANDRIERDYSGDFFAVLEATSDFNVEFDDGLKGRGEIKAGLGVKVEGGFKKVTLVNTTGTPISVEVGIAYGEIRDNRLKASGTLTVSAGNDFGHSSTVTVGTSATQIVAADTTKTQRWLTNKSGNDVWLGGAGVTVGEGGKLPANGQVFLDTGGAIYGVAAANSDVSVAYIGG